ncbi:MAG: amidohydrolase family protein [Pseudomonadota bacterium]
MDKPFGSPPPTPLPPHRKAPQGACDAHVHLLAGSEFPLWDGRVENPAEGIDFDSWIKLYQEHLENLGCSRGLIVHSILYGSDNSVTISALKRLGDGFKGVGLLPDNASDQQLDDFASANICAVRLNYVHGGILGWEGAKAMAPRLADRDMHVQMLLHADQHIDALAADIRALPVPLVIDHCGWPSAGLDPDGSGIDTLCALLAEGRVWVKLSGLYRLTNAPFEKADRIVAKLAKANPERCLWGSDWPYIMLNGATQPNGGNALDALDRVIDDNQRQRILVDNPAKLFRF